MLYIRFYDFFGGATEQAAGSPGREEAAPRAPGGGLAILPGGQQLKIFSWEAKIKIFFEKGLTTS
jgi:hypothetical protein